MKNLSISILLSLLSLTVLAEDITYSIISKLNGDYTKIDSILVENFSNNTKKLFDQLSNTGNNKIILGTIDNSFNNYSETYKDFSVISSKPGTITVLYNNDSDIDFKIRVLNISGQMLYDSDLRIAHPGNSIEVKLSGNGYRLVQFYSTKFSRSFKALASGRIDKVVISTLNIYEKTTQDLLKSVDPEFSVNVSDSIRITVYKENYFAWPTYKTVVGSDSVKFDFEFSKEISSGISDAYIAMDKPGIDIEQYNSQNGDLQISYTDSSKFHIGGIITIDLDTMGYLRRVVGVEYNDGVYNMKTENATLNELFINQKFKLHTAEREVSEQLKSTNNLMEISKALTDEDGYIHPYKIVKHGKEGQMIIKSAFDNNDDGEHREELIDFYEDLKQDLYGNEGDNVHLYIDEGHASAKLDAVFEFDWTVDETTLDEDTKVKKGDLNSFKFYLDGEASFLAKLALDMQKDYSKNKEKKLIDMPEINVKFVVPPGVPVWIKFDSDIYSKYEFDVSSSLHADWGFESTHKVQVGGFFESENESFTPIKNYEPTNEIYPLRINGEVDANARLEIFPCIEVKFYNFLGPYAEIVPYIESNYTASLLAELGLDQSELFIGWNSGVDLGLDFRVGAMLSFLAWDKKFDPKKINLFEKNLWTSPKTLQITNTIPDEVNGGEELTLKFKVLDLFAIGNQRSSVELCPVYLEGDGSFNKKINVTDLKGEVTFVWNLPDVEGLKKCTATIFDANQQPIDNIELSVNVIKDYSSEKGTFTDPRDGEVYNWTRIGDQVWMADNLRYIPTNNDFDLVPAKLPVIETAANYSDTYKTPYCYVYGYDGINENKARKKSNYPIYGVLYTKAAADIACPAGWTLPSDNDWVELEITVAGEFNAVKNDESDYWEDLGEHLKSRDWELWGVKGSDDLGFSGLGGGMRDRNMGSFVSLDYTGYWWTSDDWLTDCSYVRYMIAYDNNFYRRHLFKQYGLSVRCVKE